MSIRSRAPTVCFQRPQDIVRVKSNGVLSVLTHVCSVFREVITRLEEKVRCADHYVMS